MTQRSKTLTGLVAAIVILLVLAGCGAQSSLSPGTYTTSITREDSTDYLFIGDWELTLTDENGYTVSKDGTLDEEGTYTLTEDQMVFVRTMGRHVCSEGGVYQWALDGKTLTLTRVDDECYLRPFTFTTHPWSLKD